MSHTLDLIYYAIPARAIPAVMTVDPLISSSLLVELYPKVLKNSKKENNKELKVHAKKIPNQMYYCDTNLRHANSFCIGVAAMMA